MKLRTLLICALLFGSASVAIADGQPPPVTDLKGTFAFDAKSPRSSRCAAVKGSLLKKLQRKHSCTVPSFDTASGRPAVAVCTSARTMFLLFAKAEDCKVERETQLANGP